MISQPTYAPPNSAALMAALNDYALAADDEAARARRARNRIVRELHADGIMSVQAMASLLGMTRRGIYKAIEHEGDE